MAKVKSFRAEMGVSVEIKGTWYKFYSGIELDFEPGDTVAAVSDKAWNTVQNELEKQIVEVQKL